MTGFLPLFCYNMRRRMKDSFLIGYNIIFPIIMILLLGYLSSESYGSSFTGYHYYSIVMLPFCIAMSVITAAYTGKEDAYKKTAVRYLYAPVTNSSIVLAKLLPCIIVICLCNSLVLLFAMLVLKLRIISSLLPVLILLSAETFTVCALGLFIGLGMKNFVMIKNILNIPISVAAVLAGVFFPIGTFNSKLEFVIKLSPLTWMNRSIFLFIYDNNHLLLWRTALIFSLIGVCFTILAVKLFKKEEFLYGDLPGYNK